MIAAWSCKQEAVSTITMQASSNKHCAVHVLHSKQAEGLQLAYAQKPYRIIQQLNSTAFLSDNLHGTICRLLSRWLLSLPKWLG